MKRNGSSQLGETTTGQAMPTRLWGQGEGFPLLPTCFPEQVGQAGPKVILPCPIPQTALFALPQPGLRAIPQRSKIPRLGFWDEGSWRLPDGLVLAYRRRCKRMSMLGQASLQCALPTDRPTHADGTSSRASTLIGGPETKQKQEPGAGSGTETETETASPSRAAPMSSRSSSRSRCAALVRDGRASFSPRQDLSWLFRQEQIFHAVIQTKVMNFRRRVAPGAGGEDLAVEGSGLR